MSFIGPVVSAVSGIANVAAYNSTVATQQAGIVDSAATQEEATARRRKRSYLSSIQASAGARGIQLSGSPLLAMAESAAEFELDIQNQKFNSQIESRRLRSQAGVYGLEAENYTKDAKKAFRTSAISTAYKIFDEFSAPRKTSY